MDEDNPAVNGDGLEHGHQEIEKFQHQLEVLEGKLMDVGSSLDKDVVTQEGRGTNMDKQMLKLNTTKEDLQGIENDLNEILDHPDLQEQDASSPTDVNRTRGKATVLHIQSQGMMQRLDSLVEELQGKMDHQKDEFIQDLESLEDWLDAAFSLALLEPNRFMYPAGFVDEENLRSNSNSSLQSYSEGSQSEDEEGHRPSLDQERGSRGGEGEQRLVVTPTQDEDKEGVQGGEEGAVEYNVMFSQSLVEDDDDEEEEEGVAQAMDEGGGESEEDTSPSQTGTITSGESSGDTEQSQSHSEAESDRLDWIRDLRIVPLFHAPTLRQELGFRRGSVDDKDLDHLITDLEKLVEDLPIQSQKFKMVKATVNFVITSLRAELADEYKERLRLLQKRWEVLEKELKWRLAQLTFERAQKCTLEDILEILSDLDNQLQANTLPEEVKEKYSFLMEFITSLEDLSSEKSVRLNALEEAFGKIIELCPEGDLQKWQDIVDQMKEAYEQVAKKIGEQKVFLEKCIEQWEEFQKLYQRCESWLKRTELLVGRETYGYTLKETETYMADIKELRKQIPGQEELGKQLVNLGKVLLETVEEGGGAEHFIDDQLSDVERRWSDLVTPHTGKIDDREAAVDKVVAEWRGYAGMRTGTLAFIDQMFKIVGTEPKESSHGDHTLLPMYITYANQLKRMEVQYNRLMASGKSLSSNTFMGNRNAFVEEMESMEMQWGPLRDNIMGTLDLFIREYNDWIMVRLQHMNDLVTQGSELVQREVLFIQNFPLEEILKTDVEELLREADSLVAGQDQLTQMEAECTQIEEKVLERQIQQETSATFSGSQSNLEFESTTKEKNRLQKAREKIQSDSDSLLPVLNILYLQLQFLQNIQDGTKLTNKVMDFAGWQLECESLLSEVELKLSEDRFEKYRSQAYDAGSVMEEVQESMEEMAESLSFSLPPPDKLVGINKTLTSEIETLSSSTEAAKLRLQLLIEWWVEYNGNYDDVLPWLDSMESSLSQLIARFKSTHPPRVSPMDLVQEIKELNAEVEDKSVVVCALESTGQSILEEMQLKGANVKEMPSQIANVRTRWEGLRKGLKEQNEVVGYYAERFEQYLNRLSRFMNWLSEFYGKLYDEVCVEVPSKASEDVISRHKNQLEVFRAEVIKHQDEFEWLRTESGEWGDYLIPDAVQENLPSPSEATPPPDEEESEFPPSSMLPYVKRRLQSVLDKWSSVDRLLIEREQKLEMSTGSFQAFYTHAEGLLNWLRRKLEMGALSGHPPADLEIVEGYQKEIKMTRDELGTKAATLKAAEHMADTLRKQVTPTNADSLNKMMEEMHKMWEELERGTETRDEVLSPLVDRLRDFWQESSRVEAWLQEREAELENCGTIGANLDRCKEQAEILQQLDEVLLDNKRATEKSQEQATALADECESGSGTKILDQVSDHEQRYASVCEETAERVERCEEATAALQELVQKIGAFEKWVGEVKETLEEKKKEKRPIGTLQTELDEHYDFMRDIETHTEEYLELVPDGQALMDEYLPNDWLAGVMQTLHDNWFGYVDTLNERCSELLALLELWERYEKDVKDLLGWIMSEADSFSKDVTTKGDKGIVDHMETCKNFMEMLEGKKTTIEEIEDQAVLLKEEDGEKKNGTSDVESRWNDVQMHWNSCCKLLSETLVRLEATEAEMRHVLLIRSEEFDWLEKREHSSAIRRRTCGDLNLLQSETEMHQALLDEVHEHAEARDFLLSTVPFLVEHSRKDDREEKRLKADEFAQRHKDLEHSLDTYVIMLKDSVPFWKQFNSNIKDLSGWLEKVNGDLESENIQFGNASVTEESLYFCQQLQADIDVHNPRMTDMNQLAQMLAKYVVPEDQEFIMEWVEKLTREEEHVTEETNKKTESLEERLKSWRVFPVEEARVVQEFLEQVEEEVDIEALPDDISSEELLERLERLETLQQMQTSNQDKVATIDRSADSADVQRALERNPDISKERSNLLQGWSDMSSTLKGKIATMKKKAKMVQELERQLRRCEEGVAEYRAHVDIPLPPSVLLVHRQEDIQNKRIALHTTCQSCVRDLQNLLNQYDMTETEDIKVPQHFKDKTASLSEDFGRLSSKDEEQTNEITVTLNSWMEFSEGLDKLIEWVRSQRPEVESLKVVQEFAIEFSAHQTRLQLLSEDLDERTPTFSFLVEAYPKHTTGDEPEVQDILEKYTALEKAWHSLIQDVELLHEISEPWKNLVDRFDDLDVWLDELERQMNQDERDIEEMDEAEGGDLSDKIVNFKDYLKRMDHNETNLTAMKGGVAELLPLEVCERYTPCEELKKQCQDTERKWEELKERLEQMLENLMEKEAAWKAKATQSIREVGSLQLELITSQNQLREKEEEIERLRRQGRPQQQQPPPPPPAPPPPPRNNNSTTILSGIGLCVFIVSVFAAIWERSPSITPT